MEKIQIYDYIDIIDSRNKLAEIEKKGKKYDEISWRILIKEIKNKVIINDKIKEFIYKIEKNNKILDKYFSSLEIIKENEKERIIDENNSLFKKLCTDTIKENINDINFYNIQKRYIHKDINLIKLLFDKINSSNTDCKINDKIQNMLINKLEIFNIRNNVLKLYYKNKDNVSYEDHIILNLNKIDDIKIIYQYIIDTKKVYPYGKLPKTIKTKEINKGKKLNIYNVDHKFLQEKYIMVYKNIKKIKNNIKINVKYTRNQKLKNIRIFHYTIIISYSQSKCMMKKTIIGTPKIISIYIFILKQFVWLIYKFNKNS